MNEFSSDRPLVSRPSPEAREVVVARLSAAFAQDVLSMDEFERRTASVYGATSVVELERLVADLPVDTGASHQARAVALPPMPSRLTAAFSNVERGGAMAVPPRLDIMSVFGNVELNLSAAEFSPGVTEISVQAVFGNVEIQLPPGTRVESHGGAVVGSFASRGNRAVEPTDVIVRLTGRAVFANVELNTGDKAR